MSSWIWTFLHEAEKPSRSTVRGEENVRSGLASRGAVLCPPPRHTHAAHIVVGRHDDRCDGRAALGTDIFMTAADTAPGVSSKQPERQAQGAGDVNACCLSLPAKLSTLANRGKMFIVGEKAQFIILSKWDRNASGQNLRVSGAASLGSQILSSDFWALA